MAPLEVGSGIFCHQRPRDAKEQHLALTVLPPSDDELAHLMFDLLRHPARPGASWFLRLGGVFPVSSLREVEVDAIAHQEPIPLGRHERQDWVLSHGISRWLRRSLAIRVAAEIPSDFCLLIAAATTTDGAGPVIDLSAAHLLPLAADATGVEFMAGLMSLLTPSMAGATSQEHLAVLLRERLPLFNDGLQRIRDYCVDQGHPRSMPVATINGVVPMMPIKAPVSPGLFHQQMFDFGVAFGMADRPMPETEEVHHRGHISKTMVFDDQPSRLVLAFRCESMPALWQCVSGTQRPRHRPWQSASNRQQPRLHAR